MKRHVQIIDCLPPRRSSRQDTLSRMNADPDPVSRIIFVVEIVLAVLGVILLLVAS